MSKEQEEKMIIISMKTTLAGFLFLIHVKYDEMKVQKEKM